MKYGVLVYNAEIDRLDLLVADGSLLGGFHCGDSLDVQINDAMWVPTRIERADDWFLMGLYRSGQIPVGLHARVGYC